MFRITRNKEEPDIKEVGLERVDGLKFPSDTRRYYVAVTPVGMEPEIKVPKSRFTNVDVFRHPVDEDTLFPRT